MIYKEPEIYSAVVTQVKKKYPKIFPSGTRVSAPASLPAIFVIEDDNRVDAAWITSSKIENRVFLMYAIEIYSNNQATGKTECMNILQEADLAMVRMGFRRTFKDFTKNQDDKISRVVARYEAYLHADGHVATR